MNYTADYLLGRRYTATTDVKSFDFTITTFNPDKGLRLHWQDGAKGWLPLDDFRRAIHDGRLVESAAAPFVVDGKAVKSRSAV